MALIHLFNLIHYPLSIIHYPLSIMEKEEFGDLDFIIGLMCEVDHHGEATTDRITEQLMPRFNKLHRRRF